MHMQGVKGLKFQLFAALSANLSGISSGMCFGWTSPVIPYFLSSQSHIKMTQEQAEQMEGFMMIGVICGLPISMFLVDKIGRKSALMLSCFISTICWTVIILADRVLLLYVARFGLGFGMNFANVALPAYIGEIVDKKIRGALSSFSLIFNLLGIIIINTIGPFLPYYIPPIVAITLLVTEIVLLCFVPESPLHLMTRNEAVKAKNSLEWLRGHSNVDEELTEMRLAFVNDKKESCLVKDIVMLPNNRRAIITMIILNSSAAFGCADIILMNMHDILNSAGSVNLDSSVVAIFNSIIMLIMTVCSTLLVDRFGRKILVIISCIGAIISLLILAMFFNFKQLGYNMKNLSWIPAVIIMAYTAAVKLGIGIVPMVISSEIFPQQIKTVCIAISEASYLIIDIAGLQLFFAMRPLGLHVPFYIFGSWLLVTLFYFIFVFPETKGKSMNEIQEILRQQKYF